jgi:hypothetical protein
LDRYFASAPFLGGLGKFVDTLRSIGLRPVTLTVESALAEPSVHIGDGHSRIIGLDSMERKVQKPIDDLKKKIRRAEKSLQPTDELTKTTLHEFETTLKQIRQFGVEHDAALCDLPQ